MLNPSDKLTQKRKRTPVVALYARVSTQDKQDLTNQLRELRLYVKRHGWQIFEQYTDKASGTTKTRPGLDALLEAAARKQFDAVVVFDLSRLTRGGPATAFAMLERLQASGVELWSYREEYFRTPVAGPILFAVAAWFAEQERLAISARVRSGMDRARERGVTFGRPMVAELPEPELIELRNQGKSMRQLAAHFDVGRGTVERRLREIRRKEEASSKEDDRRKAS